MSCITWDGHTLAADRLSTGHLNPVCKVHRLKDGSLVGGSGDTGWLARVYEWMDAGRDIATRPNVPADTIKVLRVYKTCPAAVPKVEVYTDTLCPVPVELPFYAIGSGSQYAMAAMHCLKNAVDAIKVAAQFDYQTNHHIDSLRFEP